MDTFFLLSVLKTKNGYVLETKDYQDVVGPNVQGPDGFEYKISMSSTCLE